MLRSLIVARMKPDAEGAVADIFSRSDKTELPRRVGVRSRTLYRFHDLYMHLIEAGAPVGPEVDRVRDDPLFRRVNEELSNHIDPYEPATWRSPADAMATEFYHWQTREPATGVGHLRVVFSVRVPESVQERFLTTYDRISSDIAATPGHIADQVCQSLTDPCEWIITSEWESLEHFVAWKSGLGHLDLVEPLFAGTSPRTPVRYVVRRHIGRPPPA